MGSWNKQRALIGAAIVELMLIVGPALAQAPVGGSRASSQPTDGIWVEMPTTPQVPTPPSKSETPRPPTPTTPEAAADNSPTSENLNEAANDTVSTFDSAVGYIDDAIPGSYLRLRYDSAYDDNRPSRAEYFYARTGPFGPGLPGPVGKIDYEEAMLYAEYAYQPWFSVFVEVAYLSLDPELHDRTDGLGDMDFGFKYAFIYEPDQVLTFQLRAWAPTGDVREGLSTGHATIEPGLLYYRQLTSKLRTEAECLAWTPLGGTDCAGEVLQYGVGLSYGEHSKECWWISPVIECVGWTVVSGKEQITPTILENATGDTIVNIKAGARVGLGDHASAYVGYGRALTGDVWYKDIIRAEFRVAY